MNILILVGFAVFGYWIVSKFLPSKTPESSNSPKAMRPWFEVLELPKDASDAEIDARYNELAGLYTNEAIAALEPELQAEASACRNQIEAAYHFASFRHQRK